MSFAVATPAVERTVAAMAAAVVTAAAMRFMAGSSGSIPCSVLGNFLPRDWQGGLGNHSEIS
jgi:hypothetical protein